MSAVTSFVLVLLVSLLVLSRSDAAPSPVRMGGGGEDDPWALSAAQLDDAAFESAEPSDEEAEPSAEASPDGGEEECVDARHLSRFPQAHLVHPQHHLADVLCPAHATLPCATADHLLVVRGAAVSYRQYCATSRCEHARMPVNSVLSHLWEDELHDGGIHLTMLDARHPPVLQRLLHRAIAARRTVAAAMLR